MYLCGRSLKETTKHVSNVGPEGHMFELALRQLGNDLSISVVSLIWLSSAQNPCDFPLYWLVNRDPYNGLLESL